MDGLDTFARSGAAAATPRTGAPRRHARLGQGGRLLRRSRCGPTLRGDSLPRRSFGIGDRPWPGRWTGPSVDTTVTDTVASDATIRSRSSGTAISARVGHAATPGRMTVTSDRVSVICRRVGPAVAAAGARQPFDPSCKSGRSSGTAGVASTACRAVRTCGRPVARLRSLSPGVPRTAGRCARRPPPVSRGTCRPPRFGCPAAGVPLAGTGGRRGPAIGDGSSAIGGTGIARRPGPFRPDGRLPATGSRVAAGWSGEDAFRTSAPAIGSARGLGCAPACIRRAPSVRQGAEALVHFAHWRVGSQRPSHERQHDVVPPAGDPVAQLTGESHVPDGGQLAGDADVAHPDEIRPDARWPRAFHVGIGEQADRPEHADVVPATVVARHRLPPVAPIRCRPTTQRRSRRPDHTLSSRRSASGEMTCWFGSP